MEAAGGDEDGKHLVSELRIVQTLRRDQERVNRPGLNLGVERRPLLRVRRVDRDGPYPRSLRRGDLVPHQREQRRDDHGRTGVPRAQQDGREEVDGGLPPPGPLDDEGLSALGDEGLDRQPLVVAQHRRRSREKDKVSLGLGSKFSPRAFFDQ